VLLRADSAFYGHATINAAIRAGAAVSVTARMDPVVKRAIAAIPGDAWEAIEYTDAIYDDTTKQWISVAEVAEVPFTAFTSRKKAEHLDGRLVVRRIPELNKKDLAQPTLFDTHRFHAFFTTSTLDAVTADKTHRGHAIIEQVNADLKNSALAHLPSGVFTANAVARPRGHRVQPHPRRRHHRRCRPGQGHHRDDPPQARHRPGQDRFLSQTDHAAPARTMALGNRVDRALRSRRRITATGRDDLTIQPTPAQPGPQVEHPGTQARHWAAPARQRIRPNRNQPPITKPSVDRG
jgi:hypothetical protein